MPETTTSADHAARVLDLFSEARELPSGERADYLERVCAGEEGLIEEVRSLLRYESPADGFLATPVMGSGAAVLAEAAGGGVEPGATLGDYRVLSLLGAGGMGEVYLAEDTVNGRQVALKLIGKDRVADARGRHFRHERRILAALNHPCIARLYGSGVTPDGQAYLVMEYVEGERLDRHCRARHLDIGERLTLFRQVCAAVTHAHQNLVVHRDLKPANIRVTPTGEPKLLDFGIAKLLDAGGESARVELPTFTLGAMMTPEYASPEQLRGEAITTASDVYSLGVVLYELLSGERPYRFKNRQPEEIARTICEQEPARLSTVIARRATTGNDPAHDQPSARLRRQLEGDLDNIVAMALRKEPARRYASVAQFSDDVRRHCEGLPVTARPDTFAYRTGKFARRHKAGVAVGALAILALFAGLIVATWQAKVALRERDRAHLAQRQAERLNGFLEKLLGSVDPSHQGKDVKVADVLDAAGQTLERELAGEPEVLAQAHRTLVRSYFHLGLLVPAEQHARTALDLERRLHGTDDPATVKAEVDLASVLSARSLPTESETLVRHALVILRQPATPDQAMLAKALGILIHCFYLEGRSGQAEPFIQEALGHARAAWGEQSSDYADILNYVGSVKIGQKDFAGAERIYRRLVALQDQLAPAGERSVVPLVNLCISLFDQGRFAEMRPLLDRLERDARRLLGAKSTYYGLAVYGQGIVDAEGGQFQAAIPRFQEALPLLAASYPPGSVAVVQCKVGLGLCLTRTGHAAEGESFLRAAFADGGKLDRAEFVHTFGNLETALGECLLAQGRHEEAAGLLTTGYEDLKTRLGAHNPLTVRTAGLLHDLYVAWKHPDEAARYLTAPIDKSIPTGR